MAREVFSSIYSCVGICRVSCNIKLCGIGPAERSWGGVKQIKDGVRSHMGAESTEKRSVIYVTAKIQESRMQQEQMEKCAATTGNAQAKGNDIHYPIFLKCHFHAFLRGARTHVFAK